MKHVDLEKFANGAFSAQVNRAIEEVTENIQNPNTDAGATRKITVTIAFKPNAERNFVATGVQTKTTLAPALGAVTAFSMGKNLQTGEVEAIEMGNQIPGQMSVNDVPGVVPENVVKVEGKTVDTDTGEIVGTAGSKVVDLRRRSKMMEGLKDALQYITGLKEKSMEPKLVEIEGRTYCTDNGLTRYHRFPMASDIEVNTLTALVDYIKGKPEELRKSSIIHVVSPTKVLLYSGLIDERNRETLIDARAIVNEFSFDSYYDQERFLIELQANFVETDDLITIMQVAGNIKSGTTANYSDDGVSQKTTIKTGVELADVIVPNPVKLRPYRTFAEIEQPESSYVFRIKDGDRGPAFKLVEADGGLWKNAVMKKIKEYLELELSEELKKHKITVIA